MCIFQCMLKLSHINSYQTYRFVLISCLAIFCPTSDAVILVVVTKELYRIYIYIYIYKEACLS